MAGIEVPKRGLPKLDDVIKSDKEKPLAPSRAFQFDDASIPRSKKKPTKQNNGRPRKVDDQETDVDEGFNENDAQAQIDASMDFIDPNREITPETLINIGRGYNNKKQPKGSGKSTTNAARASSPLEGIRKGLEDQLTINNLLDVLTRWKPSKDRKEGSAEGSQSDSLEPLIQMLTMWGMQGGGDSPMSPQQSNMFNMALQLATQPRGGGGNSAASLIPIMTTLMKLPMAQNQNNNNNNNGNSDAVASIINELTNQIKDIVNSQRQPQQPAFDMNTMIMMNKLLQPQPQNNGNQEILLAIKELVSQNRTNETQVLMQNNQLFQQQQNKILVEALMTLRDRNVDPKRDLMETAQLINELQGEKRLRTKDELEFEGKKLELQDKKEERRERQQLAVNETQLEHDKSMALIDFGKDFLGGQGLGTTIGSIASALSKKKKAPSLGLAQQSSGITGDDLNLL